MAGLRSFVIGCVLSAASVMTPVASAQAVPLAAAGVNVDHRSDVRTVDHRYGHGYYRPYARPYRHYRPNYGYRPYRPYYRPGVSVYIAPRPVYRNRYVGRYGSSHVDWCLARYRSYDPATNRFLSYGGVYRVCASPYR